MVRPRPALVVLAAALLALAAPVAEARPGQKASPKAEMPKVSGPGLNRPSVSQALPYTPTRPQAAPKASSSPSMGRAFMAGLVGVGLFGLLTGAGPFGALAGIAGWLGLLVQLAILAVLARLAWRFLARWRQA
jgi:predicted lipid-binding transport protein (Tim44 family)